MDCNYTFPIDLTLKQIQFVLKSIKKVYQLLSIRTLPQALLCTAPYRILQTPFLQMKGKRSKPPPDPTSLIVKNLWGIMRLASGFLINFHFLNL